MARFRTENHDWFRAHLGQRLESHPHPLSGTFELTFRCNFRCRHCYLGDTRPQGDELGTAEVIDLLDQMADAGCLGITLTGGEPLMRSDFGVILRHAVKNGFLTTVFTNAALVTEEVAGQLAMAPPRCIEVSLCGADAATYEKVTGSGANFEKSMHGLDMLLSTDIDVVLKAVLLVPVLARSSQLRELADRRGLSIRLDPAVDLPLGGGRRLLKLRPDPRRAVDAEFEEAERVARLVEYDRIYRKRTTRSRDFSCGAGWSSFNIDPAGKLSPCLMSRIPALDLTRRRFAECFGELAGGPRPRYLTGSACQSCDLEHLCSYCPGLADLEERLRDDPSDYYCRIAHRRAELLEFGLSAHGSEIG